MWTNEIFLRFLVFLFRCFRVLFFSLGHYEYIMFIFNIFDVFQSTAVIILIDVPTDPSLASENLFKLDPESFGHNPTSLYNFL